MSSSSSSATSRNLHHPSFSLTNPSHQNELLDLFFDKLYSASWDSLDQLEYVLKEVLKKQLGMAKQQQDHEQQLNATKSTRKSRLTSTQKKVIKEAIDQFMEKNVEPELKKCMDVFEIILTEQVLPRVVVEESGGKMSEGVTKENTRGNQPHQERVEAALGADQTNVPDNDEQQQDTQSQEDGATHIDMNTIIESRERLKQSTETLKYMKRQEMLVDRYSQQVEELRSNLEEESPTLFSSIDAVKQKRLELQRIFTDLNENFDPNPMRDVVMEDMEERVEILGDSPVISQEY